MAKLPGGQAFDEIEPIVMECVAVLHNFFMNFVTNTIFVLFLFAGIKRIKTAHNLPQQAAQVRGQIFIQKQQQQLKTTQWPT